MPLAQSDFTFISDLVRKQAAIAFRLAAVGKAQASREQYRWSQLGDAIGRIMNPARAGKE